VKERLTGAIILVVLIVLLVPELLTGPIGRAPRTAAVASSLEEPPLRSYTIKLAEDARSQSAVAHAVPDQPTPLPAPAAENSTSPAPASEEPARSSAPPAISIPTHATHSPPATQPAAGAGSGAVTPPPPAAQGSGTYFVQLGSFASRANADRLARQLRAQGFTVSVSQGGSGHLYRVRVGPARDHSAASELVQHLHARGHSGAIVPQ
jgi:cell division septation protein DedD